MPDKYGDKIRLLHVVDAITKIDSYLGNASKKTFKKDTKLQDACIRQLQIIGEACNRSTKKLQNRHPEIPWAQISGLRNIVIHDYAGIDADIIWNIIKSDLPSLLNSINSIIENLPDQT